MKAPTSITSGLIKISATFSGVMIIGVALFLLTVPVEPIITLLLLVGTITSISLMIAGTLQLSHGISDIAAEQGLYAPQQINVPTRTFQPAIINRSAPAAVTVLETEQQEQTPAAVRAPGS